MRASLFTIFLLLGIFAASPATALTSTYGVEATLMPASTKASQFGFAVAISGDEALVVEPLAPDRMFGSATVYRKDATDAWSAEVSLSYAQPAIDGASYLSCNGAAIGGDTVALGAPSANSSEGIVLIFQRTAHGWIESQVLSAPTGEAFESFGCGVALSGSTLLVGAPGYNGKGAAYVFVLQDSTWTLQSRLTATGAADHDAVGLAVALDGDLAVMGAPHTHSDQGAAYVFERVGGIWLQKKKLTAADGSADDQFGASVSASKQTVAVGAPNWSAGQGQAYVYAGPMFTLQTSMSVSERNFGSAVAMSDERLVVGAIGSAAAYAYTRSGAKWYLRAPLIDVGLTRFGGAVSISGSAAIIGAPAGNRAYVVRDDEIFGNSYE